MVEIDGARYAGSGTIVRQAIALAAVTGQSVRLIRARAQRRPPGLRPQHLQVVKAIAELVEGTAEGLRIGSQEVVFHPGRLWKPAGQYDWDIGSAGSTTMLALAVLPVLAFAPHAVRLTLRGGLFQDCAPSAFHLQHVIAPLLARFGLSVAITVQQPGYVPRGGGVLQLGVTPSPRPLSAVTLERAGSVERIWGMALASHLRERQVTGRMAAAAAAHLRDAGYEVHVERLEDEQAVQPGAAFAVFADRAGGARLGADGAGAPRRPAEAIGQRVARDLLEDLRREATLDRWAADQVIPFAALAQGTSCFRIPWATDHVVTNAWLVDQLLGCQVEVDAGTVRVTGAGLASPVASPPR